MTLKGSKFLKNRAFFFFSVATAILGIFGTSASNASPAVVLAGADIVEFRLLTFSGPDSYPRYRTVDPKGPLGDVEASLRCVDTGYDRDPRTGKTVTWRYREMMVLDPNGIDIARREPRANVPSEKGYRLLFGSLSECDKAAPTVLQEGARCTLKLEMPKLKPGKRRSAQTAIKLIESRCEESK